MESNVEICDVVKCEIDCILNFQGTEEDTKVHNDLIFFTNEPKRDLYSRFSTILKSSTQLFDILVGYFRTSGFFKNARCYGKRWKNPHISWFKCRQIYRKNYLQS